MTPVLEALIVAALAGTLASVSAGFINRAILRFKKHRKLARQHKQHKQHKQPKPPPSPEQSVHIDVDLY
jgi:hypothetical protein